MILQTRGGPQLEYRSFALSDMVRYGYSNLRNISPSVSEQAARGVPALYRAARMRAEAVAGLRLRCWRGEGPLRQRDDSVWQARLFAGAPNDDQTRFSFWETVGESLAWRGNAYIWKNTDPLTGRVVEWYALHPDQVACKDDDSYSVTVRAGYMDPVGKGAGSYQVGDDVILHIRGHGDGGTREAPSPIQVFRDALASPVERQRHEARMWRRGTSLQLAVVFPQTVSRQDADAWRQSWQQSYEGTSGETTAVVGGGAEIKPIGMTIQDAAFVDMAHLTVEDSARIMGVPANLLGVQLQRAVPNLEQDLSMWIRFGLGPELERIESAVSADQQLFGPLGRSVYPAFDTDAFVRADLLTEATILIQEVQAGILLPDEARRILGQEPLPNGMGQIPQITPVGGAPNPVPVLPAKTPVASSNGSGDY